MKRFKMAPLSSDVRSKVLEAIATNNVMIFSKTTCPFCKKVKELFGELNIQFQTMELDKLENGNHVQELLQEMTGQRTVPNVFIGGAHIGGCDDMLKLQSSGELMEKLSPSTKEYDYDLVVIGGGSGGLAAAKEAASFGKKVAVCDFVKPTPKGTKWGLGGTCVNVGCIPKKLMHQAALLGEAIKDSRKFGWQVPESKVTHRWELLKEGIQSHIGSLNWGYRVVLKDKDVAYINGFAVFQDAHTIEATSKRGKKHNLTSERFLMAMGMRPRYPDIPGVKEYAITSDDLFSLDYCPGKTVCVGASYVSLECAGFLAGIGLDVTVIVRSILLRGFDQEMADKVGDYMEKHSINFVRKSVPTRIERLEEGQPGKLRVYYKPTDNGTEQFIDCNTVLMAIGRDACTIDMGLENAGVIVNSKNGKIPVVNEQTNIPNIYAVGDILEGNLELTPVAIQAGRLLARRLYGGSAVQCDYTNVPTTVFTPLEYGACGLSEEDAIKQLGQDSIEVYHSFFTPLEYTVAGREENACYAKIICDKTDKERVIGLHVLGPNAGEITQGYGVAMKAGARKEHFDTTIGIHPTCSELFTTLSVTRKSGQESKPTGC